VNRLAPNTCEPHEGHWFDLTKTSIPPSGDHDGWLSKLFPWWTIQWSWVPSARMTKIPPAVQVMPAQRFCPEYAMRFPSGETVGSKAPVASRRKPFPSSRIE
jgi:hypothetical protein